MINLIELKYFKCFETLKLPLANLTVLSGTNASGKSSVLQALALLCQTMRDYQSSDRIILNGNDVSLGTVFDVVDQVTGRDRFEIGLADDEVRCNWAFAGGRRDMSAELVRIDVADKEITVGQRLGTPSEFPDYVEVSFNGGKETDVTELLRFLPTSVNYGANLEAWNLATVIRDAVHLTAEREGPRDVYPLIEERWGALRSSSHVIGARGEYAVSALFQEMDEFVSDKLALAGASTTLARQVESRLAEFFPGCRMDLSRVQNANAVVLGIRTSEQTEFLRPIHCGFGVTQILPIIVAILSASSSLLMSPLILIENPEVHLHPSGQALMGQFLAEAAHAGVQIIAETHSDHVLNGVRRAVKSGKAKADEVAIHFFQDRFRNESQVLSPMLDPSGNIDVWPDGFFDQFDKDLDYFAGWGE